MGNDVTQSPGHTRTKLLIDCDPGHDDLVAILFAARHLDLVGVTTVHGNNSLANTTRNGLVTLELGGIDVPLAMGAAEPLVQASIGIAAGHGHTGLDGHVFTDPLKAPVAQHAVEFIIEMASRHRGELVLAMLGPATNVALAIRREPQLRQWLREITLMGGSTTLGNITPAAEFNVAADPDAAAVVFESGIPLRMVGYNITRETGFGASDIQRLRSGGRVANTVADLMAFYLQGQRTTYGVEVAPIHDVCAITPYVAPELIDYLFTSVRIELTGTFTRGMTVCDLRHPQGSAVTRLRNRTEPNCHVAISARSRQLVDLVIDTLIRYELR